MQCEGRALSVVFMIERSAREFRSRSRPLLNVALVVSSLSSSGCLSYVTSKHVGSGRVSLPVAAALGAGEFAAGLGLSVGLQKEMPENPDREMGPITAAMVGVSAVFLFDAVIAFMIGHGSD